MNMFKMITAALIVLKLGHVGHYAEMDWGFILSPLAFGILCSYLGAIVDGVKLRERIVDAAAEAYMQHKRDKIIKQEREKLEKQLNQTK